MVKVNEVTLKSNEIIQTAAPFIIFCLVIPGQSDVSVLYTAP